MLTFFQLIFRLAGPAMDAIDEGDGGAGAARPRASFPPAGSPISWRTG